MRQLVSSIVRWVRDDLGYPASLHDALSSKQVRAEPLPALPEVPISISASSVVRWHEWGSICDSRGPRFTAGEMLGWSERGGHYSSFYLTRDDLARIGTREVRELWECDIQDVVGLSSSKSELRDFSSLDDLVETNSRSMIEPVSTETLDRNLAWSEIRILHRDSTVGSLCLLPVGRATFPDECRRLASFRSCPLHRVSAMLPSSLARAPGGLWA